MYDYQMFRTVRMKGFDRDEVIAYIQSKDEEFSRKTADLEKEISEKDRMIEELKSRLVLKDAQRVALENEIETKYKKYIENYDKIGALVYESQVKGDQMVADAKEQADRLVGDATKEADRLVGSATEEANKLLSDAHAEADELVGNAREEAARIRSEADTEARTTRSEAAAEVDRELKEGKQKYSQIQAILNDTVELINQVQKRFMSSYKDVHELVADVASERALAEQIDGPMSDPDDFDGEDDGPGFETGELNFDLREALLDSEDEELDEIPVSYQAAAEETPAEEAPAEEAPAEETPAEEPPAEETPAEEAAEDGGPAKSLSITGVLAEAARAIAEPLAGTDTDGVLKAVSEAAAKAADDAEFDILSEAKPLEGEADAFFRGANV